MSVRSVLARVGFSLANAKFEAEVPLPEGLAQPRDVLPAAQALDEAIVARAVNEGGNVVSCRKGCAACCRQVVPVSQPEARRLAELVAALPEPRQSEVRARFSAARQRLSDAGWSNDFAGQTKSRGHLQSTIFGTGSRVRSWKTKRARFMPIDRWCVGNIWSPRRR